MAGFAALQHEETQRIREELTRTLGVRAKLFQMEMSPDRVLSRLVRSWTRGGSASLQKFLSVMEKRFPGSLKAVAWDQNGRSFPLSGPVLSGRRIWENIARRFFLPAKAPVLSDQQLATDADVKALRSVLGKKAPLAMILASRNTCLEITWLEQPCLLFHFSAREAGREEAPVAGVMLFVFPGRLPLGFWQAVPLELGMPGGRDRLTPAVMIDVTDPRSRFSQPGAPRSREFFKDLRREYRRHRDPVFPIGTLLATEVPGPEYLNRRVFLIADLGPVLAAGRRYLAGFSLILGLLLVLVWRWSGGLVAGAGEWFSFRLRMTVMFLLALSMPVAAFLLLGRQTLAAEEEKMTKDVLERLKAVSSELQTRYRDFYGEYGKLLTRKVGRIMAGRPSRPALFADLDQLVKGNVVSGYYLAETSGTLEHWCDPPAERTGDSRLKMLVRESLLSLKAFMNQQPLAGTPTRLAFPGTAMRLLMAEVRTFVFPFALVIDGDPRLLAINVRNELLEKHFTVVARREQAARNALLPGRDHIALEFFSPQGPVPESSPFFPHLRASGRLAELKACQTQGEVAAGGRSYAYFLSSPGELLYCRPILFLSVDFLRTTIRQRFQRLLLAGTAALTLAGILGLILSAGLLGPVGQLDEAVQSIRQGDLSIRLPLVGNNELTALNRLFNEVTAGLQERERMRAFVSEGVMKAVRDEEAGKARSGEGRIVTVLFSHIKGFHDLQVSLAPHDVFALLNGFLAGAERCVRAFGGQVDKFIGDAVMAVFPDGEHQLAAIRAAEALNDFVRQYNLELNRGGKPAIRIGIGINTGPVIMGDIGSAQRKDLTVIGDTVNVAARLESVSDHGRGSHILVSATTIEPVRKRVRAERLPSLSLKGKQANVEIFEVAGVLNVPDEGGGKTAT